jgi:pyrroline-5-carboxylate reductase
MKDTVFLGGGRITGALVAGLRLAGYERPIVVHDRNPEKLRRMKRELGGGKFRLDIARDLKSAVGRAEMLVIAVRPASVAQLLEEVARCGAATRSKVAVSLAAGVPLRELRGHLGASMHWARAMPSPVCRVGRGLTALNFERSVTLPERKRVRQFFAQVGPVLEIPESQFDAFCTAFSPSYGYHALATLAEVAREAGLDRKVAVTAAAHALGDGILYWKQARQSLEELLEEAATPGGVAAATMAAMDRAGYKRSVSEGLAAGIKRARGNKKK